jgi:L-histidine N-alpha-methyltransferase
MTVDLVSHLAPEDAGAALRADVLAGLTATPKTLPPTWSYDERGSELFDEITRLPEYYPPRAERSVLTAHAADIAAASGADTLVELGSGTSERTRLLLRALSDAGTLRRFVPFDVDPSVLLAAGAAITEEHPGIEVTAVVGDFTRHLTELPRKDPVRLVRAYDDAAGVTAAFDRNVLAVVNRELTADFDVDAFEHVAVWDAELAAAGLRRTHWWTDPDGDVGVSLAVPATDTPSPVA